MKPLSFETHLNERGFFRIKPGLQRVKAVLAHLGHPERRFRAVHIAGTNGKGSTAAMLESIFRSAGHVTGLYTSPHLVSLRERFLINGKPVGDAALEAMARCVASTESLLKLKLTYFEFTTVLSFLAFAEQRVDIAIIETGLGGRWDATNVLEDPEATLITSIDFDHTQWLGRHLRDIALHKAGIFKRTSPVIVNAPTSLHATFRRLAAEKNAPIQFLGTHFTVSATQPTPHGGQVIEFHRDNHTTLYRLNLLGAAQASNAALAIATVHALRARGWRLPEGALALGLQQLRIPGRMEVMKTAEGHRVILDGAHNVQAMAETVRACLALRESEQPTAVVFSCFNDKDVNGLFRALKPLGVPVYLSVLPGPRSASIQQLARAARRSRVRTVSAKSPEGSLRQVMRDGHAG